MLLGKYKISTRVDRFIASNSLYSRSDIRKLVKSKRVEVNGLPLSDSSMHIDPACDQVFIDGERISLVGYIYVMLNKPKGYLSANKDADHPTVIDLINQQITKDPNGKDNQKLALCDLQIVGRLDIDTTGLLLLTNDGQWNHSVTAPNSQCKKWYHVTLASPINEGTEEKFLSGIQLEGESKKARPARLEVLTKHKAIVTITEGKYHQVKRMFAATGNRVTELHRQKIGSISLDENLCEGEFRFLTPQEITSVGTIDTLA